MGFNRKEWKDRITEYPTRRNLVKEDGSTETVTVERNEGSVSQEGDAFSAENMNGLEQRIEDAFGGFSFYPEKLTQAQYDALPEETKATPGLIFVIMKE